MKLQGTFQGDLARSTDSVTILCNYLKKLDNVSQVRNHDNDMQAQRNGYDVSFLSDGNSVKADVKFDQYPNTKNLFVEIHDTGWLYKQNTQCNCILYLFTDGTLYVLPFIPFRNWIDSNKHKYPTRQASTYNDDGTVAYKVTGLLVPREEVHKQGWTPIRLQIASG